jgi:hypothetical protein
MGETSTYGSNCRPAAPALKAGIATRWTTKDGIISRLLRPMRESYPILNEILPKCIS